MLFFFYFCWVYKSTDSQFIHWMQHWFYLFYSLHLFGFLSLCLFVFRKSSHKCTSQMQTSANGWCTRNALFGSTQFHRWIVAFFFLYCHHFLLNLSMKFHKHFWSFNSLVLNVKIKSVKWIYILRCTVPFAAASWWC